MPRPRAAPSSKGKVQARIPGSGRPEVVSSLARRESPGPGALDRLEAGTEGFVFIAAEVRGSCGNAWVRGGTRVSPRGAGRQMDGHIQRCWKLRGHLVFVLRVCLLLTILLTVIPL